MSITTLHGLGGGSLCNHDSNPNAYLLRSDGCQEGDGCGLFVISKRYISAGEFVTVDYGKMFLASNKSNINYFLPVMAMEI